MSQHDDDNEGAVAAAQTQAQQRHAESPKAPGHNNEGAADAAFVSALEAVDAFLAAQERLAASLREAHQALSRAKYSIAASGGGVAAATATLLPLRRPPPPQPSSFSPDDDDGSGAEVRAERWVELVGGGGSADDHDCARFELRTGPVPQQRRRRRRQGSNEDDDHNSLDDPRSPPPPCPESVARADAARLRWAGASGALPPPALREAQARFGDALAAAVRAASAARAARLRAEGAGVVAGGGAGAS